MSEEDVLNQREEERLKKISQRLREKMTASGTSTSITKKKSAYKCRQTAGKALRKLANALPTSPTKQREMATELFLEMCPEHEGKTHKEMVQEPNGRFREGKRRQQLVRDFHCSDNVSCQAPGKQDFKSVKNEITGKKERIPVRHMLMNISDAHNAFIERYPEEPVCLSRFLRGDLNLCFMQVRHHTMCVFVNRTLIFLS